MLIRAAASPTGLDDARRVEAIRLLESLSSTASALQAHLAAELDASQRAVQADAGVPSAHLGRGVAAQVAFARRESPHRGQRHLGLARIVPTELPHTWAAWRAGRVTEWKVSLVARETACLSRDDRSAVDALVAADPAVLEEMGERQLVDTLTAEAARLDAAAVVLRRRRAEADRHVSLRPAPDTMTWLTALLPVKDGVRVLATLTRAADAARAAGDARTRGQVMADVLVARAATPTPLESTEVVPAPVTLGVVMSDAALLVGADDPAHLEGYGPVPAELAREIVAGALGAGTEVSLRRLYSNPDTGELVAMDARARCFRGNLAAFIRLRDRTCRTPWCDAPVRQVDHAREHAAGGATSALNGQGLCEACNRAKQAPGWRARPGPDGSILTELPTGDTYTTRPPPLATIRRRRLPAITLDYVLAGP